MYQTGNSEIRLIYVNLAVFFSFNSFWNILQYKEDNNCTLCYDTRISEIINYLVSNRLIIRKHDLEVELFKLEYRNSGNWKLKFEFKTVLEVHVSVGKIGSRSDMCIGNCIENDMFVNKSSYKITFCTNGVDKTAHLRFWLRKTETTGILYS